MDSPFRSLRSLQRVLNPANLQNRRNSFERSNRNIQGNLCFHSSSVDTSRLSRIPNSLLVRILSYLTPREIVQAGLTSKKWYMISRDESLWKHLQSNSAFCPAASPSWFREYFLSLKMLPSIKLDNPRTIPGSYGQEMLRAGQDLYIFRKNEDQRFSTVTQIRLETKERKEMSYIEFLEQISCGLYKAEDIADPGTHFYDAENHLLYWACTLAATTGSPPLIFVHAFDTKKNSLFKVFNNPTRSQDGLESNMEGKALPAIALSMKVQNEYVVVRNRAGFIIWDTAGHYLGKINTDSSGNYWIHENKFCIFDKQIIEYSLNDFTQIQSSYTHADCLNADASVEYKQGVLSFYHCLEWKIFTQEQTAIKPVVSALVGKITARWNDDRFIVAANSKGEIIIYNRKNEECYPIRNTGIKNIIVIEQIYRNLFLIIDSSSTGKYSEGHVQLRDLKSNICIKDFGTCVASASRILSRKPNFMIIPISCFDGSQMIMSFKNMDRKEYQFKIFDFSSIIHHQTSNPEQKYKGILPSKSI